MSFLCTYLLSLFGSLAFDQTQGQALEDLNASRSRVVFDIVLVVVCAVAAIQAGLHLLLVSMHLAAYSAYGLYLTARFVSRSAWSSPTAPWRVVIQVSPASLDTLASSAPSSFASVLSFSSSLDTLISTEFVGSINAKEPIIIDAPRLTPPHQSRRPTTDTSERTHESLHARHPDSITADVQTASTSVSQPGHCVRTTRKSEGGVEEVVVDYLTVWNEVNELNRTSKVSWIALTYDSVAADEPATYEAARACLGLSQRACKRFGCTQESQSSAYI